MRAVSLLLFVCAASAIAAASACSSSSPAGPSASSGNDSGAVDAGANEDASAEDEASTKPEPPAACGAKLPGAKLDISLPEAQKNYQAELDAVDISKVPDPYDYSQQDKVIRAIVNYMLGRASGTKVTHAEAEAVGGMGRAVLAAAAKGTDKELDFFFLRRGLYHFYKCTQPIPKSLDDLKARYGDWTTWKKVDMDCSRPKNGPRTLWEGDGVIVAETLTDAGVREVEALFEGLREDGQLDFAVYTPEGELSDRSTFSNGTGEFVAAAPFMCMACHVDTTSATYTYTIHKPTGTGAGCQ